MPGYGSYDDALNMLSDNPDNPHYRCREEIKMLRAVIATMNAVSLHQAYRQLNHPLTCGNDSNHAPLYPWYDGERVCLICRDCGYMQPNAGPYATEQTL